MIKRWFPQHLILKHHPLHWLAHHEHCRRRPYPSQRSSCLFVCLLILHKKWRIDVEYAASEYSSGCASGRSCRCSPVTCSTAMAAASVHAQGQGRGCSCSAFASTPIFLWQTLSTRSGVPSSSRQRGHDDVATHQMLKYGFGVGFGVLSLVRGRDTSFALSLKTNTYCSPC